MNIEPIAHFRSPLTSKFGVPRQAGIAQRLRGSIVFEPGYRNADALRGLDEFDFLWIIWGFSANVGSELPASHAPFRPTVRPPLLGGNARKGVWATRSPFRPNHLGLSSVRIERIEQTEEGPVVHVLGADLMDGTPIFDLKPYLEYVDSHVNVRSGFVDTKPWQQLTVVVPEDVAREFTPDELQALKEVLAQDPRPAYHDDASRVYGLPFAGRDVRFRVEGNVLKVER